jgi:hypothetical protein
MSRRIQDFQTIRSEGGLLPPDLLRRVIDPRAKLEGTQPEDYGLPKGERLNEVITQSWNRLRRHWGEFRAAAALLPEGEAGTGLTNDKWNLPLFRELGFGLLPTSAGPEIGGRTYAINRFFGPVPIHLIGCGLSLDRRAAGVRGAAAVNPHGLVQEFLNRSTGHLWAILSNGMRLRFLRDNQALSRQSYLEFDLEAMFSGEVYSDFVLLWLTAHATRFAPQTSDRPESCWLEQWTKIAEEEGTRALEALRGGVESALQVLGQGLVGHAKNTALREALRSGNLTLQDFHGQLLRVVYRLIFLFVAEDRTLDGRPLIHPIDESEAARLARERYAAHYSTARLRELASRIKGSRHGDLWQQFQLTVGALSGGERFASMREALALPILGSMLWNPESTAHLNGPGLASPGAELTNFDFLEALRHLAFTRQGKVLRPVDYKNLGSEEFGGVYESLLALTPQVSGDGARFFFAELAGNQRKTSGSFYTPDSLVQRLLDSALDPVVEARLKGKSGAEAAAAILSLTVCDASCGSGHFLIGAAHRLARHLARVRALDAGESEPSPLLYQHALRDVIAHCIYGVDLNPMALELCKVTLWLEAIEPGLPLSFLDHHLQCGDALLGLTDFAQLRKGIAKDAFTVLSGDHKDTCKILAATNRDGLKALEKRLANPAAELFDATDLDSILQRLTALEAMPDHSPAEVEAKAAAYTRFLAEAQDSPLAHACDLLVAAYLTPKTPENQSLCPTTATLNALLFPQQGTPVPQAALDHATALCREARVFHWPLRFVHIFGKGGFSCVLGNPPWERIKLQEQEFFAAREPLIAEAKNKAERAKRIQWLSEGSLHYHLSQFSSAPPPDRSEVALFRQFEKEKRLAEATSAFAHVSGEDGGRFALTGVGDVNTYALFAETIEQIRARSGRAGFIVPTGIATDDSTKAYFSYIAEGGRLARLIDFENREGVFPGVHKSYKFSLLTLGAAESAIFSFFLTQTDQLADERRSFALAPDDFALINPNTRTCPVFRSQVDAELTRKIYRCVPVLIREADGDTPETNPWGITFSTMFHMANDSHLFLDATQPDSLPLYEAKMMHQFDHRWADYVNRKRDKSGELVTEDISDQQKLNLTFRITPRYWVPEREVLARLARAPKAVRDAFRDQNADAFLAAIAVWIEAGHAHDLLGGLSTTTARKRVLTTCGPLFEALPPKQADWLTDKALAEARQWPPLTEPELAAFRTTTDLTATVHQILDTRSPRWLIGWRDITNATNERTVIASVLPRAAVGHTMPLFYCETEPHLQAAMLGNWDSLTLDFIARQKIGGTHLTYSYLKQFPILPPSAYSEADLNYIVPRVLELTYTADDLSGWAQDVAATFAARFPQHPPLLADPAHPTPFGYHPTRRAQLRAELDARYARLYGLTREELEYILDPSTTHGPDYPTVTFPGLKNNELKQFGEYRTRRLVLEAWDRETRGT